MLRDHLVEGIISPLAQRQEANSRVHPTPETWVGVPDGTIRPTADWIVGIVDFPNENLARAFDISLGSVDAGVVIICKLALQRFKCLLKHRRVPPMRAERL